MRIILYTGKGGVGKTCVSAATAVQLARSGKRVLVASTDVAHSLGDALDVVVGSAPVAVAENLWALEIDSIVAGQAAWGRMQAYLRELMGSHAQGGMEADELLVFPGLDELFALLALLDIEESGLYDVLVVDCAPTGETLSLLKYPERLGSFIEQILPLKRTMLKIGRPVIEGAMKIPMPDDELFDEVSMLVGKLERLRALLVDEDRVSVRIVTTAERIVVKEAKRALSWLRMYGYNVDAVIVNRLYPAEALVGYFDGWARLQSASVREIEESFSDVALVRLSLRHGELRGLNGLGEAADELFGDVDPAAVLARADTIEVREGDGFLEYPIPIPFFEKQDLDLQRDGDHLIVSAAGQTRRILLDPRLRERDVSGARYEEGFLVVRFDA